MMKFWDRIKGFALNIKSSFTARTIHTSDWWKSLTASWESASFSKISKIAHANPHSSRGLRLIGQTMASVPIVVETQTQSEGDDEVNEVTEDHPVLDLLRRPNPRQTWRRFIDTIVTHLHCGGEIWVERRGASTGRNAGRPRRLYLWRPDRFDQFLVLGKTASEAEERLSPEALRGLVKGDIYGYRMRLSGKPHDFTIEEMLQVRVYNPQNENRGLPILIGAHRAMQTMQATDDWNKSIATGGGRVPGYWIPQGLPPGGQLSEEAIEQAEANLDRRAKERKKSNMGMVLSGSFDWKGANVTPREADWLKGDMHNARKVATVMGIPPELLGDIKGGSLTDAGVNSQVRALLLLTVLPLVDFVLEELNEWLMPLYGENVKLAYNEDAIQALREDVNMAFDRYHKATGGKAVISVNEARKELGYEASEDERHDMIGSAQQPPPALTQNTDSNDEDDVVKAIGNLPVDGYDHLLKMVVGTNNQQHAA